MQKLRLTDPMAASIMFGSHGDPPARPDGATAKDAAVPDFDDATRRGAVRKLGTGSLREMKGHNAVIVAPDAVAVAH